MRAHLLNLHFKAKAAGGLVAVGKVSPYFREEGISGDGRGRSAWGGDATKLFLG